jgi:hypothetical protein
MRRAVLLAATMAIVAVLAVGTASADPVNSKNVQIVTFNCGGEQVTVAFLLNPSAVLSVVDTTGNFVITRVEGTVTFTDPKTGEMFVDEPFEFPIGQGIEKKRQDSLTTCETTTPITFEGPKGTATYNSFKFTGFFTPRRG